MLDRCQFALTPDGTCGVITTYPIKGYPWRRNPTKHLNFSVTPEVADELFLKIQRIQEEYPGECLTGNLWSDTSEKSNGVTRDIATNTLCYTVGIYGAGGKVIKYDSLSAN